MLESDASQVYGRVSFAESEASQIKSVDQNRKTLRAELLNETGIGTISQRSFESFVIKKPKPATSKTVDIGGLDRAGSVDTKGGPEEKENRPEVDIDQQIANSFIVRTVADGYNSGRTYYFKCSNSVARHAPVRVYFLVSVGSDCSPAGGLCCVDAEVECRIQEAHPHENRRRVKQIPRLAIEGKAHTLLPSTTPIFRRLTRRGQAQSRYFYQHDITQGIVAFLIVANFVVNIAQVGHNTPDPTGTF